MEDTKFESKRKNNRHTYKLTDNETRARLLTMVTLNNINPR